ncbi:hypothetical protein LSH36_329g02028 [Paralvinella palmiformis]|uniref:Uncharacterized protein n=1 Tax=Paralvinella palmiformis TaxID=53620 RepID=A0AAD9N315_9ANNE|nr:hypothetical protein LSH36_329g02028 [Paralvinella palmiformis]
MPADYSSNVMMIPLFLLCIVTVTVHVSAGVCVENPNVIPCYDNTYCQCISAPFELCDVPISNTNNWTPGAHVMSNCENIPLYTAVATFDNGHYNWQDDLGHAGLFYGDCTGSGFKIIDQWCGRVMDYTYYPVGGYTDGDEAYRWRTDAVNYYVINPCPVYPC